MSEDLSQIIENNLPLPERDIEALPTGPFPAPEGYQLSSYLELATALAKIPGASQLPLTDLFPAAPASSRFTLLAVPGTTVLAAADRSSGARDQLETVFRSRPAPALMASADDLGDNTALFFPVDGNLKSAAPARVGFAYHWVKEISAGKLVSDLGLAVDGNLEVTVELSLAGSFLAAISLDGERWLRLRLFKSGDSGVTFASHVLGSAQAKVPPDADPEQLILAMLGVHDGQWLDALASLAKLNAASIEARFGAAATRFLSLWRNLETQAASVIWNAAASVPELTTLRDWIHRVSTELRNPSQFKAALAAAIESVPDFAGSPAGLWIQSAVGGLLDAVTSADQFRNLLKAADAADRMLNEQALVDVLAKLKAYAEEHLSLARIKEGLESLTSFGSLDEWLKKQLRAMLGTDLGQAIQKLQSVIDLARATSAKAMAALEKKYSAELSFRFESASNSQALIDCSFDFTADGLAAYRAAVAGDFSFLGDAATAAAHTRVHQALLTHGLSREANLELQLPFLDRKQWKARWEALAHVQIQDGEDGRLVAYTVDAYDQLEKQNEFQSRFALAGALAGDGEGRFTLSYTDQRSLPAERARTMLEPLLEAYGFDTALNATWPEGDLEAKLTLSIPGSLAACWLHAPGERDTGYFATYSAVSVAVQTALRQWLPYVYFNDLDHYDDLSAAFPLMIYQTMRPFPGQPRSEFTYDVMSPGVTALASRAAIRALTQELARVEPLLMAAGKKSTARFYEPGEARSIIASVERQPRLLNCLLTADAFFVDNLVRLGLRGREFGLIMRRDPAKGVKQLARLAGDFVNTFHRRLRRLYGSQSFVAFGSLLLVVATQALGAALEEEAEIAGVLRLSGGGVEQTFVNSAFRP
jgi:hypothetical protein